jgi:hypothetical protein
MAGGNPTEDAQGETYLDRQLAMGAEALHMLEFNAEAFVREQLDGPVSEEGGQGRLGLEDQLDYFDELRGILDRQAVFAPEIVRQMKAEITGMEYCARTIAESEPGQPEHFQAHLCVIENLRVYTILWQRLLDAVQEAQRGDLSVAHYRDIYALRGIASVVQPRRTFKFLPFEGSPNEVPVEVGERTQEIAWGAAQLLLKLREPESVPADTRTGKRLLEFLEQHGHRDVVEVTSVSGKERKSEYRNIGGIQHFIQGSDEVLNSILNRQPAGRQS